MTTPRDFAYALLGALNLPTTDNNVTALIALQKLEGGFMYNSAAFNPLNTSLSMPGSRAVIGAIQAYTDWNQGLEATARTLSSTHYWPGHDKQYPDVIASFAASADPDATLDVWAASPWGTTNAAGRHAADSLSYGSQEFPLSSSALPFAAAIAGRRGPSALGVGLAAAAGYGLLRLWKALG